MAISKIKSDSVDSIAATKLTGTVDNARITLDAAEIPNLDAAKITTGTVDVARLPSTVLNSNVAADLHQAHQGIASLGLLVAIEHNKVAGNYGNTFLDIFQDDSGITTETTVDRNASEYVSSVTSSTTVTTPSSASDYTGATGSATIGSGTVTWTGTDKSMRSTNSVSGDFEFTGKLTAGDGGGGWLGAFPVSEVGTFAEGHEAGDMRSMTNSFFLAWTSRAYVTNGSNKGSAIQTTFNPNVNEVFKLTRVGSTIKYFIDDVLYTTLTGQTTADMYLCIGGGGGASVAYTNLGWSAPAETTNATGTLVSDTQTAASSTTEVSGVFLYTDADGTNTIGTDLKIYFTANNGTNWTEAVSYGTATTFSGSIKQVKCGKTTVTAGTQIAMKAVWANQLAYSAGTSANAGDYTGTYSAGNRSSIIAVTTNVVIQGNVITNLVLGGYQSNSFYFGNDTIGSSEYIRFALSAGQVINEFRWYNDRTVDPEQGTWQWQGSNNGSSWTNIGSTFAIDNRTMGGNAYQTVTTMSGNTTSYTWYQMKGVSGTVTTASNHGEITFKTGYVAGTSAVTGKVAHLNGWAVNY